MDLSLVPHPASQPGAVKSVKVQLGHQPRGLHLLYVVEGDPERLRLPPRQEALRADDLWQTTCFELFVHDPGEAYREFNFSPSSQWAAYALEGYRAGRKPLELDAPPLVGISSEPGGVILFASLDLDLQPSARLGLSAVVEEADGTKSYWALAHSSGDKPDFHDPACFALELPPAPQP